MDLTGVGAVADLASTAVNTTRPDKTEKEKQQLAAALAIVQGQLDAENGGVENHRACHRTARGCRAQ